MLKKYTGEKGRKLKERMKIHRDDGEKLRKDKRITGLSLLVISLRGMMYELFIENKTGKKESSKKQLE